MNREEHLSCANGHLGQDLCGMGHRREDIWAAGHKSAILHYDGSHWELQPLLTRDTIGAIFGLGPGDIWAVGQNGVVLHYESG